MNDAKEHFVNAPVPRDITWGGSTKTYYFRRLTGAERLQINSGQKITVGDAREGKHQMELDMGTIESKKHLQVQLTTVTEQGQKFFRNLDEVRALPDAAIGLLYKASEEVNKDDEQLGKG